MLFNSKEFLFVFLPSVLALHFLSYRLAGARATLALLLVSSLGFYCWWDYRALALLLGSIGCNFAAGRLIGRTRSHLWLSLAVAANLLVLGYFKYYGFFLDTLAGRIAPAATGALPLGISFFTFHQIAYLVDARRGQVKPHGGVGYGLFVSFFPQLIAGPILSQKAMLPQLTGYAGRLDGRQMAIGWTVFVIGLFKKVIVADGVADWANAVFAAAGQRDILFPEAWAGALSYTFQIYFDFSGYSDMAIGLALMFGLSLPLNFASPYGATSIIQFWRCWHMTLSWFLREYLYVPLGGNRHGAFRRYRNLMLVMLLGGLWHGAGWTFVIWGGLHGAYLCLNHGWRALGLSARFGPLAGPLGWVTTFLAVVVAWVFFRADSLDAAANILKGLAGVDGRLLLPASYQAFLPSFSGIGFATPDIPMQFRGVRQVLVLLGLCAWVLLLPNTRSLMRRASGYDIGLPVDAQAPEATGDRLPLYAFCGGFAGGYIALVAVLAHEHTHFLYFQF